MHWDAGAVAILATFLALQTGALIYFAGRMTERVNNLTNEVDDLKMWKEKAHDTITIFRLREGLDR